MGREEILEEARQAIVNFDNDLAIAAAKKGIESGLNPIDIINDGLSQGMKTIGDLFERGEIFLPEVILASEAMVEAVKVLDDYLPKDQEQRKAGKVVIGTIEGDIHDIGKGIVTTLLRVYGFEVHDLGRDAPIKLFVESAKNVNADIVGTSALMTTTMVGQKKLEQELAKAGIRDRVKTMIGGAVVTQRWADKIGADGYAENAQEAVMKAKELVTK